MDYRSKNPYAIPANLNKHIPYDTPYIPPHGHVASSNDKRTPNFTPYNKPVVFKEQTVNKPIAYVVDIMSSKVFTRLFPMEDKELKQRNFHLNLSEKPLVKAKPNARSIFKNYKSCPVSPVSEECKWIDKVQQNVTDDSKTKDSTSLDPKKRNSLSFFIGMDNKTIKSNGKSIVDTIKSDTEKMIAEITKKYGDLDEFEPNNDLDIEPTKEAKDDGNFSSDSLEDCSLSQDASCKNKLYSKKVCKKHNKTLPKRSVSNYEIGTTDKPVVPIKPAYISNKSSTLPRNMPSNLDDILDEDSINYNYSSMYRCQSVLTKRCVTRSNESVLSENSNCSSVSNEIFLRYGNEVAFQQAKFDSRYNLNESQNCSYENLNEPDENYLDKHRHSSASFFLNQKKYMKNSCSQESMLSDDMYLEDNQLCRTNCNSLESVLSDDSECTKSAPLEMLFEGTRPKRQRNVNIPRDSKSCYEFDNTSKSYGSSPNNTPHFSYLYNNYLEESSPVYKEAVPKAPMNQVYGFEVPTKELSGHKSVTRSKSLYDSASNKQPPPAKNIAYYFDGSNVQTYSKDNVQRREKKDEIPRLSSKDYMANTSKSLQPKCADKYKYKSQMEGCDQNAMVKSKSCSFEVVLEPASKPNPLRNLMEKRNSHVQKNLEKFEEQIRKNTQTKVNKNQMNKEKANGAKFNNATKSLERGSGQKNNNNNKITMEFVPHKPPKPIKRTSSVKMNNRLKAVMEKTGLTSISSQYKAKLDGLQNKNYLGSKTQADNNSNIDAADTTEKSFDIFVKEKDVNENKSEIQMDSLEVYAMEKMERMKHVSIDSLDVIDGNDFAKDSLDYYAEQENKFHFGKTTKDKINITIAKIDRDINKPSHSRHNIDSKENIAPVNSEDIKQYKNIERKIEIINKLVEMEERKILQEKFLKEWRMRPLKANIDDGQGVVKVLSRKFEKLATKQTNPSNFPSLTLEDETEIGNVTDTKEIKRNLSLPDILDSEQIGGLVTVGEDITNESGNEVLNNAVLRENAPKSLKQRVYNEMVIPKTDVHLDSENYESSTTSSSCTNSPKRLSLYGLRPKNPFRKMVRVPTPRLCMENKLAKIRPCLNTGVVIRAALFRKVAMVPVLPSKFTLNQG